MVIKDESAPEGLCSVEVSTPGVRVSSIASALSTVQCCPLLSPALRSVSSIISTVQLWASLGVCEGTRLSV